MSDGAVERITEVAKERECAGNGAAPEAACGFGTCGACGAAHSPHTCPQLLPCLHSLCKVCLHPGAQEDVRVCPVCDGKYTLMEVKNDPFFRGHTYNSRDQVESKCGGCEDTTVSGWCVECGEALCAACVLAHRRVRVTRDHKVLPQQLSKGCVPITFCLIHKQEPLKLFCLSCDQLTCRDCQLTYHRNHRFQFVSEAMADLKQDVRKLMEKVRCQKSHVQKSLLDLDGRLSDLTVLQYKVKMDLRDTILSLRNVLVARAIQLVEEMKGYCGREMDSIFKRQEVLRKLKEHQEHVLAFAERALYMDDHYTLLTCKKEIQQQLQILLSCSTQPTTSMIEMELQFEQELHKIITNYGRILVKNVPFKPSDHPLPSKHPEPACEPRPAPEPPSYHRNHPPVPVTTTWTPPSVVVPHSNPPLVSPLPLVSCPPSVIPHHSWTKTPIVSLCSVQLDTPKVTGKSAAEPEPCPAPKPVPAPQPVPPRQSPVTPKPCSVQPDLHLSPLAHQSIECRPVPVTTTWMPPSVVGPQSHPSLVSPFPLVSCPPSVIPLHRITKTPMVSLCSVKLDTPKVTGKSAAPCVVPPASTLTVTSRTLPMPLFLTSLVNVMVPIAPQTVGLVQNVLLEKEKTFHAAATRPKYQAAHVFSQITTPQSLRSAGTAAVCAGAAQTVFQLSPGTPCSVLSVKALADSPCEWLPPAVGSPEAKQVLPASENEPTSTVMEADTPMFPEGSVTEGTANSQPLSTDERLTTQVTAPMSTDIAKVAIVTADDNTGIGNAVIAATVTGADSETAVLIEHPTIMTAGSRNKIVPQETPTDSRNKATDTLIDMPVANATAGTSTTELTTDMSSAGVNMPVDGEATEANHSAVLAEPDITRGQHLSQANGQIQITASACHQISSPTVSEKPKPSQNFTVPSEPSTSPSSFREAPEGGTVTPPQADSLSPGLGQQETSEGFTSFKNAKVGSPPSSTQVKLEDESFRCPLEEDDDSGETDLDSGRIHAYSELVDRCLLPCVSLIRIPIPMPLPGRPLPSFYILPGTKKNEILLQTMEEKGQFSASLDPITVSTCLRAPPPPPVNDRVRFCAVCRVPGAAMVCSVCSCSFHRKCHIPSVNSETSSNHWQCMLCRDFSDVGDQYCSSVDGYPSLSLLEQRKCEHVLLVLLCETHSSALYQQGKSSSHSLHSISIMSIQGRLSRKLKPVYRTPSQFVSDVLLLFGTLKSSKESSKIAKLQSCFEKTLFKVFGKSISGFPKYAFQKKPEAKKWVETASPRYDETLKRMREFLRKNPCAPPTKRRKDGNNS